jgi:menaquinone-specific isochorismate synthase
MEELLNKLLFGYSEFLTAKISTFKKNPSINSILSYVFELPIDSVFLKSIYLLDSVEKSFFFKSNSDGYQLCAFNSILSINENGKERFARIEKKLKSNFPFVSSNIENYVEQNFPLFVGGMKFTVEHNDEIWKQYEDSAWFIPELLILNRNEKVFLVFNSLYDSSFSPSLHQKKLRSYLNQLINVNLPIEDKLPKVRIINGNTPKEKKKWSQQVNDIKELIFNAEVTKVVLSRTIEIILSDRPTSYQLLNKLFEKHQESLLFLFKQANQIFFGASPEMLFSIKDKTIYTEALAGSAPRSSDNKVDSDFEIELLSSEKEVNEHSTVVEFITSVLTDFCTEIKFDKEIKVKKLNTIQHIWTPIEGPLKNNTSIFPLLEKFFPTPAVCGNPKEAAHAVIKKIEEHRRGLYSGIIGWFNLNNSCDFAVAIRSGVLNEKKLTAFAGCGIVAASKPETEFAETNLKFNTLLSIFSE